MKLSPLTSRAVNRQAEHQDLIDGPARPDLYEAIAVQTGIPVSDQQILAVSITGALAEAIAGKSHDVDATHTAVHAVIRESIFTGWLIRDEQLKLEHEIEPAPVCEVTAEQLLDAGHKFCPGCGIVRAAHHHTNTEPERSRP